MGQEIAELEELVKANDADAQFRRLICPLCQQNIYTAT